jgi:hypothetical protein
VQARAVARRPSLRTQAAVGQLDTGQTVLAHVQLHIRTLHFADFRIAKQVRLACREPASEPEQRDRGVRSAIAVGSEEIKKVGAFPHASATKGSSRAEYTKLHYAGASENSTILPVEVVTDLQ